MQGYSVVRCETQLNEGNLLDRVLRYTSFQPHQGSLKILSEEKTVDKNSGAETWEYQVFYEAA